MSSAASPISEDSSAVGRGLSTTQLLALLVVGGAILRFATLESQDLWFDEYKTLALIEGQPHELLGAIAATESTPPLYYLLAKAWLWAFGDGELALRSLPALLGTATIPVVYLAAGALGSRRAGLIAAALTAASPLLVWYSQEARAYALLTLLATLSFLCFVHLLRGGGRSRQRWLWAWAIASMLALSAHYLAAFAIAVEAAILLWRQPRRRFETGLAVAAIAAAAITLTPLLAAQRGHAAWIELVPLGERLAQLPQHFLVGLASPWPWLPLAAVVLAAAACGLALARTPRPELRGAALAAAVALGGFAMVFASSLLGGPDFLLSRNLLALWAPFAAALGALLAAPALGRAGPALAGALCALGVGLAIWSAATPAAGRPDWQGVVAGLGPPAGERAVIAPPLASSILPYLGEARAVGPQESVSVEEVAVVELRRVDDPSIGPCWWLGFCGGADIFGNADLAMEPPSGLREVAAGSSELFDYRLLRARRPVELGAPLAIDGVFLEAAATP